MFASVSIHARFISRAIQLQERFNELRKKFQSTPGLLAGRYPTPWSKELIAKLFQSTPGLLAGRYDDNAGIVNEHWVSIHARFISRAIPTDTCESVKLDWFQSTPGLLAGRYSCCTV